MQIVAKTGIALQIMAHNRPETVNGTFSLEFLQFCTHMSFSLLMSWLAAVAVAAASAYTVGLLLVPNSHFH